MSIWTLIDIMKENNYIPVRMMGAEKTQGTVLCVDKTLVVW